MGKSNTVQTDFWFRNDNGSLTTATFMGAQNSIQNLRTGTANKFRVRFAIVENAGGTANVAGHLFYSLNGGTYTEVTAASSVIREVDDNNSIADDASTTSKQLTWTGTFVNGRYSDDGVAATATTLSSTGTELEFCLYIVDADVTTASTIDLRVYDSTTALNSYTQTARLYITRQINTTQGVTVTTVPTARPTVSISESESVDVTDAAPTLEIDSGLPISETESVGVTDVPSVEVELNISVAETVGVVDIPQYYDDEVVLSESVSVQLSAADSSLSISKIETVDASDSITAYVVTSISETQAVGVADVQTTEIVVDVVESETVGVSDVASVDVTLDIPATESVNAADVPAAEVITSIDLTESISVADVPIVSTGGVVDYNVGEAETIGVSDVPVADVVVDVSKVELVGASDVPSVQVDESVFEAQSVTAGETLSISVLEEISTSDGISVEDTPRRYSELIAVDEVVSVYVEGGAWAVSETESVGVTDVPAASIVVDVSEIDAVGVGEALSLFVIEEISVSDAIGVTDIPRYYRDLVIVTDYATVALVGGEPAVSETESVNVSDVPAVVLSTPAVSETESVSAGETLSVYVLEEITISDGIGVQDIPRYWEDTIYVTDVPTVQVEAAAGEYNVSETETVNVTDVPALEITPEVVETENVNVSDVVTLDLPIGTSVSDGVNVSDVPSLDVEVSIFETESVGVTDVPAVDLEISIFEIETVGVVDAPTVAFEFAIVESESVNVADVPTLDEEVYVVEAEGVGVADSATLVIDPLIISTSDTVNVSEARAVAPVGDGDINEAELVSVSTSATLLIPELFITTNDGVTVSDIDAVDVRFDISEVETVGVSDVPTVSYVIEVNVTDGVSVSDVDAVAIPTSIAEVETITVGDSPTVSYVLEVDVSDNVSVADVDTVSLAVIPGYDITTVETVTVGEAISLVTGDLLVTTSSGIVVSEAATVIIEGLEVFFENRHGIHVGYKAQTAAALDGVLITDL